MKKLLTFLFILLCGLFSIAVNVGAQTNDKIWLAGDTVFDGFTESQGTTTVGELTFTSGVRKDASVKMYKGERLYNYFKLPDNGNTTNGSIKFNVSGKCDIYIIGNSNANGVPREVVAYSTATNQEQYVTVDGPAGYKIEYRGGAGSIYLYAKERPIRVYGIAVRYYPYSYSYDDDGSFMSAIEDYTTNCNITKNIELSSVKIYATESEYVSVVNMETTNQYGQRYYRAIDLKGLGTNTYRSIGYPVKANYDIYITAKSPNASANRELIVTNKYYETICDNITITPEVTTYKIEYYGSGDEVLFRSADSGIRIYEIEVVPRESLMCYDKSWNFSTNDNFVPQQISATKVIDDLRILGTSQRASEILAVSKDNYTKAVRLGVNQRSLGEVRFNVPNSSEENGLCGKRTIRIYASAPENVQHTTTLVLSNRQGLIYGSQKMQEGKTYYGFEYSGKGEMLCLYAVSDRSYTSYIDIYELSTSYHTNVLPTVSRTIQAVNGQNIQLYFSTSYNPQTNGYTYTITYDNSKLSVVNIGLSDGVTNYGDNGIEVISNSNGVIKFRTNRKDVNWSGIFTSIIFRGLSNSDTTITFSGDLNV